jgi:hypothetical protein
MDSRPNKTKKFRPQDFLVRYQLRHMTPRGRYNWLPRFAWNNQNYLHKVFSVLHYRSSHAPVPVQQRWRHVAERFLAKHKRMF